MEKQRRKKQTVEVFSQWKISPESKGRERFDSYSVTGEVLLKHQAKRKQVLWYTARKKVIWGKEGVPYRVRIRRAFFTFQ